MDDLSSLLLLLARKSPLILVLLAGLACAVIRWRRHPRASLLASIGITLYIIDIFVISVVYYVLPGQLSRIQISISSQIYMVIQILDDLVYSAILILLVSAAFSERPPKPSQTNPA
jgi:hypothetical protein